MGRVPRGLELRAREIKEGKVFLTKRSESAFSGKFFRPILFWTIGLVALALAAWLASPEGRNGAWTFWGGAYLVLGWIGLFLPFATYSGGLAAPSPTPTRSVTLRALSIAALYFVVAAFGKPVAEYRQRVETGGDITVQFPLGPETPATILSLAEAVRASPPERFSFSTDRPLARPPNWLMFSFHSFFALAAFCILSAFLGQLVAFLTNGLSPPARTNTRWAVGLITAFLVLAASTLGNAWVRQDFSNSGYVGAWAPLVIPLVELGLLMWLARHRGGRTHPNPPGSPSD